MLRDTVNRSMLRPMEKVELQELKQLIGRQIHCVG
jgi:hypothetical protein